MTSKQRCGREAFRRTALAAIAVTMLMVIGPAEAQTATYSITVQQSANGTIGPSSYAGFKPGATQAYTITPNVGYHVADVKVDGTSVGSVTSFTFSNIQANHAIGATFEANPTFVITASAGAGGTISPAGTTSLLGGQTQKYVLTPAPGYRVGTLLVDGATKGAPTSYSFYAVNADHSIAATFVPDTYSITAAVNGAGGTISPPGASTVTGGGSQSYSITPDTGYRISYVAVNGASVGSPSSYSFTNVRQNYTIAAAFVPVTYTVTVQQAANGTISPSTYNGFKAGAGQTYTIIPNAGFQVSDVRVDGASVGAVTSYSFTNIQASHTITASFQANPTYLITSSAGTGGSISPSGTVSVPGGTSQKYSLAPAAGYRVADVIVDGVSKGPLSSFTFSAVSAPHVIAASFVPDTYTITAGVNGTGGTISPPGASTVPGGGAQAYSITPDAGHRIAYVALNGASVGSPSSYSFTNVRQNYTITAAFVPVTYTVLVQQSANGTISPSTYAGFTAGASQTYFMVADAGYQVADVLVDGVSVGARGSYGFTNIQGNHSIAAVFELAGAASTCVPGVCSSSGGSCEYDSDCAVGETCNWNQPYPRFVDNGDQTVTDRRTCLMWEKKTQLAPPGFDQAPEQRCLLPGDCPDVHGANNFYYWSSNASQTDGPWPYDGTVVTLFLDQLNATAFAGHSDWRLPTSGGWDPRAPGAAPPELESLVMGDSSYCMNTLACVDPVFGTSSLYETWTSTSWKVLAPGQPDTAFVVYFYTGRTNIVGKELACVARAVRSAR